MFHKLSLAGAALAMGTVALAPTAQAQRYDPRYEQGYDARYQDGYAQAGYARGERGYDRRDGYRSYDRRDGYRSYDRRNDDRRYYNNRRCSNGTTGTIVGAIAGGLLGRSIDTGGDRTLGTLLGGVGGAVAGNALEKSGSNRRCR